MLNTLDSADLRCGTFAIPEVLIKELELKFKAAYDWPEYDRAVSVLDRMAEYNARLENIVDMFETTEFERSIAHQIEFTVEGYRLACEQVLEFCKSALEDLAESL